MNTKSKLAENKDALANTLAEQAHGHYLDRLERAAQILERRDLECAVLSLRQLYRTFQCKPKGSEGILYEISLALYWECKSKRKFTRDQLNRLFYVLYSSLKLGLKPPPELVTDEARSNT